MRTPKSELAPRNATSHARAARPGSAAPANRAPVQAERLLVQLSVADLDELIRASVEGAIASLGLDTPALPQALLSKQQLAQTLGVSERTVDTLRKNGMPTVSLLGSIRFEADVVLTWIRERSSKDHTSAGTGCSSDARNAKLRLVSREEA